MTESNPGWEAFPDLTEEQIRRLRSYGSATAVEVGDIVFLVRGRVVEHAPAERFFTAPATQEAATFIRGGLVL